MSQSDAIDRPSFDTLLDSVGGDMEFMRELAQTYFEDSPALFQTLHTASVDGNAEEFRRAAHSLKSSSANFGALELSRRCKELEDLGKAGALGGVKPKIAAAEEEFGRVRAALEAATAS